MATNVLISQPPSDFWVPPHALQADAEISPVILVQSLEGGLVEGLVEGGLVEGSLFLPVATEAIEATSVLDMERSRCSRRPRT